MKKSNTYSASKPVGMNVSILLRRFMVPVLLLIAGFAPANPHVPSTQLRSQDCGRFNLELSDVLYADPVPGATAYDFQLEFFNTHQVLNYTNSTNALNLSLVTGIFVLPELSQGTTYRVKVRAHIGSNIGNYGSICFINIKQDAITLTQALQEPRNNVFFSQLITIQTTDAGVIPTTSHGQLVTGVNSIAPQYHALRTIIKNAVMSEGGNQNQVQFQRINIDDALPNPVCREIFEVRFPVMVNIDQLVTQLRTTTGIKYACTPYNVMQTCGIPFTDPGAGGTFSNWNINNIQAPNAWVFLQGAPSQATAIMESGSGPYVGGRASFTHPDLVGRILNAPYPITDISGHATSVAGVICGNPNGTGIIGVGYNTTNVASYTLAFGNYFGELAALAASNYQAGSNPRFLNCSYVHIRGVFDFTLGGWYNIYDNWTNLAPFMAPLIALQVNNNVLITASAGNSMYEGPLAHLYLKGIGYPFGLPDVIGVGATFPGSPCGERGNGSGDPYTFANSSGINWNYNFVDPTNPDPVDVVRQYDGFLDMTAPGSFIDVATYGFPGPTDHIQGGSAGTSFSAPTVCAAAACMASVNPLPTFTNADITRILFETSDKVGYDPNGLTYGQLNLNNSYCLGYTYNSPLLTDPGKDYCLGRGRLNMLSALMNAAGLNPGGYTINNAMGFNCITVNDINDHTYLYTTNGYGNFNESFEYDGVLNQNGAVITFDGNNVPTTTVSLELAPNSTFRTSNGATFNIIHNANLLLQPGSNLNGFGTRFIIENGGIVNLSDRTIDVPTDALVEIKSGGTLNIANNTGITVQSGGTLVVRSGANLVLQGTSNITVQPGGYICIENGANITLQNTGSIINIQPGAFSGSYAQLLINTNCVCPGNVPFTGSGNIIQPFNAIYGFKYTSPLSIVKIDLSNGSTQQTITVLPTTLINITAGSATYDPNGGFYIFCGADQVSGNTHYRVDVSNGTFTQTPVLPAVSEYEFNANTNELYGLAYTSPLSIVKVDPANGSILQTIAVLPSTLFNANIGSSTLDPVTNTYYFSGADQVSGNVHISVDLNTGFYPPPSTVLPAVTEYEFDVQTGELFGFAYTSPLSIVKISPSSGAVIQTMALLPTSTININSASSTYDPSTKTYYFSAADFTLGNVHDVVDLTSGSVTPTQVLPPVTEYNFANCAPSCPVCRVGNFVQHDQPQSKPLNPGDLQVKNYPDPFTDGTSFEFTLPADGTVSLEIYSSEGKLVATPVDHEYQTAGSYTVNWRTGNLNPGIYFYKLKTSSGELNRKMVIMK